ncbi:MAG: DNA-binding protein [Chloroflexi bacterium]|nr:DNA-binding protein [Chloroflexota bacterium]
MPASAPNNDEIAAVLERIANLLEAQASNPFRVRAYRQGAASIRNHEESVAALVHSGDSQALDALPNIGQGLANLITELVESGRSVLLERLQGEVAPEDVFVRVPGIGEELAQRIVRELGIETLEELEVAAHDGRLAQIEGFGPRRLQAIRASLTGMLSRSAQRRTRQRVGDDASAGPDRPPVALVLAVDETYRRRAEADDLPKIAPRRYNPDGEAWLPIMHEEREGWQFTVLYSNTAQAHELGTTHDWVVIYYERNGHEQQNTVVTETSGPLKGRRVVRGREGETRRYYESQTR